MRILIATPTYLPRWGGAEMGIYHLARRWAKEHTVCILTPSLPGDSEEIEGVAVRRYHDWLYPPRWADKLRLPGLKRYLPPVSWTARSIGRRLIRTWRPDVINLHYALPNAALLREIKRLPTPAVVSLSSRMDTPGHGMPPRWEGLARRAAAWAQANLFLTRDCQMAFWPQGAPEGVRSLCIPYGADMGEFDQRGDAQYLRSVLGIPPEAAVFLALQRLVAVKRVDRLIDGLAAAQRMTDRPLHAVIAGKGPATEGLRQRAAELGLAEQVHMVGFVPQERLGEYYRLADCFVFTSSYETFGVVLVEAMAAGVPVIAMDSFAVRNVVDPEATGWLVPPDDATALAERLVYCAHNPERLREMGRTARQVAETRYNWDVIAARYVTLFEELIG